MISIWLWIGFLALVGVILAIDLGVLNRHARQISPGRALANTGIFILLALAFTIVVYFVYEHGYMGAGAVTAGGKAMTGSSAAVEYLSAWILEYTLSVDNLFVFTLVFSHFAIPIQHQHRVLFWGILGALVLRGVMIVAGASLVASFSWVLYIFGLVLIVTAIKMVTAKDEHFDPGKSLTVRLARKVFPVTDGLHGDKFFVRTTVNHHYVRAATPLFLVLLVVEATDVVFAVDSIPAAFSLTREPFIIFTSNVFAIMGLRSLYFALAGLMKMFKYLKLSLALVLVFVGVKMLIEHPIEEITLFGALKALGMAPIPVGFHGIHVSSGVSLGVIISALTMGVLASLLSRREHAAKDKPPQPQPEPAPKH